MTAQPGNNSTNTHLPFLAISFAALLAALPITKSKGEGQSRPLSAKQPNVILCMADDHGWRDAGYQGHPFVHTPHLDKMAAEGLRFNRWYAAAPVCSPTPAAAASPDDIPIVTAFTPLTSAILNPKKSPSPKR